MLELMAVGGDDDTGGKRRAILIWAQRTEIVGNPLRQHRHDAVGKIDRIAAILRLAVERAAGVHIGGDIGDGDAQNIIRRDWLDRGRAPREPRRRDPWHPPGSMVTSGIARQSSRCAMLAGLACSASAMTSGPKTCGIWCAWMAMRLIAFSLSRAPSLSRIFAVGRPRRDVRKTSTATRSPSCAVPSSPGPTQSSPRFTFFLSIGTIRPPPRGSARKIPDAPGVFARGKSLMTRPV